MQQYRKRNGLILSNRVHKSNKKCLCGKNNERQIQKEQCQLSALPLCNDPYLFNFNPRCKALRVVA